MDLLAPRVRTAAGTAGQRAFLATYLVPTVGLWALAMRSDMLWKRLNFALLLLTRAADPVVRVAALCGVGEVFSRGAEDALVLLPESLPFVSESLEAADEEVESHARALLRHLEEVSGERLDEYLSAR
jgi:U3 small nucleolar RNA-associated protein 10